MKSAEALATLQELGSTQRGLVTTSQAEQYGISRVTLGRLRDRGLIHQERRGVYMLPSGGDESLQDLHAAWLSTEPTKLGEQRLDHPDLAVSHHSAARVHGLGDLVATQHEFTSVRRRRSSQPDVRINRGDLPDRDVTIVGGLPVTSIPRTVADLAAADVDFDHLAHVVRDALSSPDVRPRELASRLDDAAQRRGFDDGNELVEASLDHAGLPAVAEHLVSTRNAVLQILSSDTSPVLRELRERIVGGHLAAHLASLTADPSSPLGHMARSTALDPRNLISQSALASMSSATSATLDPILRSIGNELLQSLDKGALWRQTPSAHDDDHGSHEGKEEPDDDESAQATDPGGAADVAEREAQEGGS